jgi:hypothetical protein
MLCLIASSSFAQRTFSGYVEVAHGYVRDLNGEIRSIKGLKLPFVAEQIEVRPMSELQRDPQIFPPRGADNSTVFHADSGQSAYGIIEDPDPSSLDDLVLAGGAGVPWQNLMFGVDIGAQRNFLIRWRVFDTFVQGRGPGVSAFDDVIADFGVIYPATAPGTYKITISVAAAGVVCPNSTIYMAQQFRTPDPSGNGPFDLAMKNVYNSGGPVSTGSSENVFWLDVNLDGIYDEDEVDYFGEQLFANHLRSITVSGSQDTLVPFSATIVGGVLDGGDITDLFFQDNSYYSIRTTPPLAPIVLEVEGVSPSASIITLRFLVIAKARMGGGNLRVELWNYQTNQYDSVGLHDLSASDQTFEVLIQTNASRYVNPSNRRVKSRLTGNQALRSSRSWFVDFDRTAWIITR